MQIEIRADGAHISGYVNVTEKKSRPVITPHGKVIEEIEPRAFEQAIERAGNITVTVDHDHTHVYASTDEGTVTLYEDAIGLHADVIIKDETLIELAKKGKIRGWSFGMYNVVDTLEQRAEGLPIRRISSLDLDHITLVVNKYPAYGYTVEELLPTMQKIGDAGAALGMGQEDMAAIATYLGRMKTTGKATLEYLTPLLERGIPVWDYLAQASGIAKDEVQEMVTRGLVPGAKAAEIIADYMGDDFAGSMEQQSQTYAGLASTMQGMQDEMNNALGEGYNEQRKLGMQEQIEWLSGESGEAMKEANRLIGEWQASLENEKERLLRESMDAVMTSDAFAEADSVEKGRMLAAAQAEANAEYLKSDGYQLQQEANEKLVDDIQVAMKDVYLDAGYNMGLKFSEGVANAIKDAGGGVASVIAAELGGGYSGVSPRMEHERGYAYGIQRVPYDNFPALLHEGERVLTASQAREQGGAPTVQVTGNSFIVREEADIDRIATALCQKIADAQAAYVGEVRIA